MQNRGRPGLAAEVKRRVEKTVAGVQSLHVRHQMLFRRGKSKNVIQLHLHERRNVQRLWRRY